MENFDLKRFLAEGKLTEDWRSNLQQHLDVITSQIRKTTDDMDNGVIAADWIQYLEGIIRFCYNELNDKGEPLISGEKLKNF